MNTITNRQVICDVLMEAAKTDKDIVVTCSDSRGSASLGAFAKTYPNQFVEMGIAEQNLVAVSAGLAACGKKVFAASPASFLSTRSYEQAKVDVAYSGTNVTLIGISGGISYGALGMTHHSCQDIAAFCSLPDMRVYVPSDRHQTKRLIEELLKDNKPAYVRVSRSATEDVYDENIDFVLNRANVAVEAGFAECTLDDSAKNQKPKFTDDVTIIACGEMVPYAVKAAEILKKDNILASVVDMYCLKPLDKQAIIRAANQTNLIVTVEEHSEFGGLGSMVAQVVAANCCKKVINIALPDGHLVAGTNIEVFKTYGMDSEGIANRIKAVL